jgi:hypothetical protein
MRRKLLVQIRLFARIPQKMEVENDGHHVQLWRT